MEIHQLAKVLGVYWREFTGNSPIGKSTGGILVKVHWTFANGESPICEIPIGELPVTQEKNNYDTHSMRYERKDSIK